MKPKNFLLATALLFSLLLSMTGCFTTTPTGNPNGSSDNTGGNTNGNTDTSTVVNHDGNGNNNGGGSEIEEGEHVVFNGNVVNPTVVPAEISTSGSPAKPSGSSGNIKYQQYGHLLLAYTDKYSLQWHDRGSGASKDVAYYLPKGGDGFLPLGALGKGSYASPNGSDACLLVKAADNTAQWLAHPVRYQKVWDDGGSGADLDGACWRPIPPAGYVALGDVFSKSHKSPPPTTAIWCVKSELTTTGKVGSLVWDDKSSGADDDFSSWRIQATGAYSGNQESIMIAPNTFFGKIGHSKPSSHPLARVLKLPVPVFKGSNVQSPRLTTAGRPADYAGWACTHSTILPFTAIKDGSQNLSWKVANSPFYIVDRWESYHLETFSENRTSMEQQDQITWSSGVSNSESQTFESSTTLSVSVSAGIQVKAVNLGVSGSISKTLGFSSSNSVSQFQSRDNSTTLNTPAKSYGAIWSLCNRIMVRPTAPNSNYLNARLFFREDRVVKDSKTIPLGAQASSRTK
jgi:hypothetical protein